MQFFKKTIRYFLLFCLLGTQAFGQEIGTVGIKAGVSIPNNLLSNLVKPGKGIVMQFNSKYFYQVRGRFSIEYYKYAPSDSILNTYTGMYSYIIVPATLKYNKFNSIDVSMGLDYNPFKRIPELYFGPQVFAGLDNTSYTSKVYEDPFNPTVIGDTRTFIHGGIRLHIGLEKAFGKIAFFTEYSFSKNYSENYNTTNSNSNISLINSNFHQFGIGIRF